MLVEVWSDVVCPWCYIGKRRFAAAVATLADDPDFDTADRGRLPAVPARPDGAARARRCPSPRPTPASSAARSGPRRSSTTSPAIAAAEGLEFHLDRAQRANTRDAHRLLWYAGDERARRCPGRAQGAAARRLLHRRPQRRRSRRARRRGGRGRPRRRRRRGASSTATTAAPRSTEALAFAAEAGHHRRADVRHRRPLVDPRRPGPGRVRAGAAAPRRHPTCRLTASPSTGAAPGRRLVLVHGFTQTGRSWDADRRRAGRRATRSSPSTRPATAARPTSAPTSPAGAELLGAAGRPGDVRRLLDGRPALPAPRRRPPGPRRAARAGQRHRRDRRRRRAGGAAGGDERAGGDDRARRRRRVPRRAGSPSRCSPRCRRRRGLDDRRRNTAAGLASSLRLAGTGTQEPLWDRLAGADDAGAPRRRRARRQVRRRRRADGRRCSPTPRWSSSTAPATPPTSSSPTPSLAALDALARQLT